MSVLIISIIFIGVAVLLLSIKLIFKRNSRFPNSHVGSNKAMRKRGISCHTSQHKASNHRLNLAERLELRAKRQ